MSKVIEFTVEYTVVGINTTQQTVYRAKSFEKLLSLMPKSLRKKWTTIFWIADGEKKSIKRENLNL